MSKREREMSERESAQRERGATRADRPALAPDGLFEEREMSERESAQRERGATRADRPALAPDGLFEEREMSEREMIVELDELSRHFVVRRPAGRLRRERRVVRAVDGISFTVAKGECVGYIGANGAGKSTTVKMLTGILVPTSGRVRVCGLEPVRQRRELARRIGVVFGQRSQLWWDLPLAESFRLLAAIHRLPAERARARLDRCVELLDMRSFLDSPVRQLSLGQRMRGEVTAALLHSPELLLLDEPTVGLDIVSKEALRSFLAAERAEAGTTILLTTHDLPDIERLSDRVVVVDGGRVVHTGHLRGLAAEAGVDRVLTVELIAPAGPLDRVPGTRLLSVEAGGLRQHLALTGSAAAAVAAVSARAELRDLTIAEPDIEDVVARLYRRAAAARTSTVD